MFAAVYLLSHGLSKIVLVALVLRDKLWAYPWLIALLGVRHRALVAVAGRIGQYRQVAGPTGRSAVGRHP